MLYIKSWGNMIDWKILNYLNKQKYKKILLIIKNKDEIQKFIKNNNVTIVESNNFIDSSIETIYDIICNWDSMSEGTAIVAYSYLSKMNHSLSDDGFIYLRVLKNKNLYEELTVNPFCWNLERINSIGKAKALKLLGKEEYITNSRESYIRFKYIPAS